MERRHASPPESGFPPHPHRDMEIITYVRTRRDHATRIRSATRAAPAAGDVQVMSAGTGRHPCRIQPRGRRHDPVPDLDRERPAGGRARLGRDAVPQGRPRRPVPAARQRRSRRRRADHSCRRKAARRNAAGRRDDRARRPTGRGTSIWSPSAPVTVNGVAAEAARRDRDHRRGAAARSRRATTDAELVLVDAR